MRLFFALVWVVSSGLVAPAQSVQQMGAAATAGQWPSLATMATAYTARLPLDPVGWTFLGLAETNLGHQAQALDAFSRSVRLAPGDAVSHTNYGAALERAGSKVAAKVQYERSLRINPRQTSALVNLARLETGNGEAGRAKALRLLRQAWVLAPDTEIAASLLVVEPCEDSARADYVRQVAGAPALDVALRLEAAHALEGCAQWNESETIFRSALAAAQLAAEQRETALMGVARAEMHEGRVEDAEAWLRGATSAGTETPRLLAALAEVEQRRGHYELAVPALLRAETLAPDDEDLRFRYGMLLLDTRTPKAAELRTREALKRFPKSARLWFVLGLSHFDQDETAPAGAAFDHALTLKPEFPAALAYRGLTAAGEQHYDAAAGYYRRAIAAEPDSSDLHCLLAEALEKEHPGDLDPPYAELERAVAMDANSSRGYLMMGRIDLDRAKPDRAIQELQKALELKSPAEQVHFFLARAYRQTHQPKLAAQESELFAKLSAASRTRERDAVEQAVRQLGQTHF